MNSSNYPYDFGMIYAEKYIQYLLELDFSSEKIDKIYNAITLKSTPTTTGSMSFVFKKVIELEEELLTHCDNDQGNGDAISVFKLILSRHISHLISGLFIFSLDYDSVRETIQHSTHSELNFLDNFCNRYLNQRGFLRQRSPDPRTNPEYFTWNGAVKLRDNYLCRRCGSDDNLVSHHIIPVSEAPEFVTDINNGICLCEKCHKEYHRRYGVRLVGYETLSRFLKERKL